MHPFVSVITTTLIVALLSTEIGHSHLVLGYGNVSKIWLQPLVWLSGDYLWWNGAKWVWPQVKEANTKKLRILWKASFKYSPTYSHACTNSPLHMNFNQNLPRGTIWIHSDELLWECGWQEKWKTCGLGSSNHFLWQECFIVFTTKQIMLRPRRAG